MADSNSPPWLKPCEVLRLHKKARRQLQMTSNVLQTIDVNKTQPLKTSQEIGITEEKHMNPFRKSPKKPKLSKNNENTPTKQVIPNNWKSKIQNNKYMQKNMDIYKDYLSGLSPQTSITVDLLDENTVLGPPEVKISKNTLLNNVNKFENKSEWINSIPVDWSLKTKVRFMSTKPFPWRGNLKTVEEASGTTSFTRCLELEQHKGKDCVLDSSPGACFYKNCLYWMHPSLPWLQLFPRMDVKKNKNKNLNQAIISYNEIIQDSLHSDWCESFRSLYQLVRTCQCPYFYLCGASFTVLFRAAGINGFAEINAMITPTTRGLRQALITEGINFTMPLSERKSNNPGNEFTQDTHSQLSNTSDESIIPGDSGFIEGNDELASDDEEPGSWLESLGLSQQDFPSLNPNKIKLDKEKGKSVDYRPQSLVYIQGMETQALVNFLLNTKLCFSKTGPLTGIPPTLLSPTAFHGGSLQSVKVRQGNVKHNNINQHVVELNGPVFPSTLHRLCRLLRQTQDGNYRSLLLSHGPTNPFCSVLPPREEPSFSAFAIENLKDCGMCKDTLRWMCAKRSADKTPLSEIVSTDGSYGCT